MMSEVSLFEYNEVAFNKLIDALSHGNCATINHATGTGKSFIALKYLYQNRDKRYLYLAPTYPILDQLIDDARKLGIDPKELNVDRLIYRTLLDLDMNELFEKYDGIIFDEYHRCGAKETFYKIKELKALLKRSNSDKKFIGLTATPIRYLDNERNMTEEIFDGVVASNLTLANAMCDELLPIPNYYISGGAIISEYEKLRRRIEELPNSKTKTDLLKDLDHLNIQGFQSKANSELFEKYLDQTQGKYIVFCKDIESLEFLHKNIRKWFPKIQNKHIYSVHSDMNNENRVKSLKGFNDVQKGFNILLCVDVLNEGVHIDNVDGVILNRRTVSPIIYFQQIGRALSFSGRKKEIQVFDLMYNYGNHEAIYAVYEEFKEEIANRIQENPAQKDKYEKMLSRFTIMDESRDMLEKIRKISSKLTYNTYITAKLENAILYVERYKKENHVVGDIFIETVCDEELIQAYYTIEKYYKHVTNSQFQKMTKLGFIMPPELLMSFEERKNELGKYDSIYEKEKHESANLVKKVQKYIEDNGKTPQENSDDLIERNLFELYKQCLMNLGAKQLSSLSHAVLSNNIEVTPWEKILLQIRPSKEDINSLLNQALSLVKQNVPLPRHIYKAINTLVLKYDFKNQEQIVKLLKYSDRLDELNKKKHKEEQDKIIGSITNDFFGEEPHTKEEIQTDLNQLLEKLDKPYLKLFKRKFEKEKRVFVRSAFKLRNDVTLSQFCKEIIYTSPDKFPKIIKDLECDNITFEKLRKVYEFMKEHDDRLPSPNVPAEKPLSDTINRAIKDGVFTDKILRFNSFNSGNSNIIQTQEILKELLEEEGKRALLKLIIAKQILFVKINERKPCEISTNPAERKQANDYTFVINNITGSLQLTLSGFMNKHAYLTNSIRARAEFQRLNEESER